jgi:hypothetical protein
MSLSVSRRVPVYPYQLKRINARSSVDIPYVSRDDSLNAVELASLRYRIDNLTDSLVILGWTDVPAPAQRGTITIPASLNAMSRQYRDTQLNQVTLEMTDTNGNVRQELAFYELGAVFQGATA